MQDLSLMANMRLDKLLAAAGYGSRKDVKALIKKGAVLVNGEKEKDPGRIISPESDTIEVSGEAVIFAEHRYYMLNKPKGVVSATEDKAERTVLDLLPATDRRDIFPVGRLDKDTTGLLLLTDDGELAHRLLSPKKHVDKRYKAVLERAVTDEDVKAFAEGLKVDEGFTALPAELEAATSDDRPAAYVTIREGKFHQVKRMFEAVGNRVLGLERLSMGSLLLDRSLAPGEYRPLTDKELEVLKNNS